MCTQNAKCEKTVTRHIWQRFVDMAEDVRHTPLYRDIYKLRQQKIERVFADAKEKHGMRYTQYRGLAQVTNWVKLKFAAMNLKKTGHLEMETEKSFSGEEAEKDSCGRLFFLAAIFPVSNEKACLGVIAKTDFFYRLNPGLWPGFFIALKQGGFSFLNVRGRGGAKVRPCCGRNRPYPRRLRKRACLQTMCCPRACGT